MLTHSNADILTAVMCQADTSLGNSRRSNVAGARQALTAFDGRFRITSTTYHTPVSQKRVNHSLSDAFV